VTFQIPHSAFWMQKKKQKTAATERAAQAEVAEAEAKAQADALRLELEAAKADALCRAPPSYMRISSEFSCGVRCSSKGCTVLTPAVRES